MADVTTWRLDANGPTHIFEDTPTASLDDVSRRLPDGAYTTFRTYEERTRVIALTAHLDRLDDSAAQLGRPNGLPRTRVCRVLADLLADYPSREVRVRLTLDTTHEPGTVYISIEPLRTPPPAAYEEGVRAVTRRMQRERPTAKSTEFIGPSRELKAMLPSDVFEIIMVDGSGYILEGTTSNVFGIRAGTLRTAGDGILLGITRSVVLDLARDAGIPTQERKLHVDEVPALDGAFLTSSSRGIVPIVQIDEHTIGDGRPGPITRRLMERYASHIDDVSEPILPNIHR